MSRKRARIDSGPRIAAAIAPWRGIAAVLLLCPVVLAGGGEGAGEASGDGTGDGAGGWWHRAAADPSFGGRLHFTYRATYDARFYRFRGYRFNFPASLTALDRAAAAELEARHRDTSDQDLDQYLAIRTHDLVTPGIESGWYQGLDTDFSARYFKDLDGTPRGNESLSTFDNLKGQEAFQLRTLNARIKLLDEHLEVTGGRQLIEAAEWVHIDGGHVRLRGLAGPFGRPIEISVFGGARVTYYSSIQDRDLFKNDIWGGSIVYRPWRDTRVEISDVHYIDSSLLIAVDRSFRTGAAATGDLRTAYRQINEDPESVAVDLGLHWTGRGLDLLARGVTKFGQNADDFNFDYTFSDRVASFDRNHDRNFNIGDIDPYSELTLEARQEITESVGVSAGATGHWVWNRSARDQYNSDWYEVWGGIDTLHVPWEGLTGRLTVRSVYTELPRRRRRDPADPLFIADVVGDGEPTFVGFEGLLEQEIGARVAFGSTVEWRLYEYESRFAKLSDLHAIAVTAHLRWRWSRLVSYFLSYSYERDLRFVNPDFEAVHGVRAQVSVSW